MSKVKEQQTTGRTPKHPGTLGRLSLFRGVLLHTAWKYHIPGLQPPLGTITPSIVTSFLPALAGLLRWPHDWYNVHTTLLCCKCCTIYGYSTVPPREYGSPECRRYSILQIGTRAIVSCGVTEFYHVHTGHSLCSFCMTAGGLVPSSVLRGMEYPVAPPLKLDLDMCTSMDHGLSLHALTPVYVSAQLQSGRSL